MRVGQPKYYLVSKLTFELDAHMENPTPLFGASSTTEGVLRGRAHGNVLNMADAEKLVDTGIGGLFGKIHIYNPGDNPSTVKPQLVIKAEVDNHIAPILKEVGDLHSPPKSKPLPGSSLSGPNNFIEKNQRVFVYEDGSWCLKGRYDKAMKINDTLAWSNNKGYYSLIMGFVELFLKINTKLH